MSVRKQGLLPALKRSQKLALRQIGIVGNLAKSSSAVFGFSSSRVKFVLLTSGGLIALGHFVTYVPGCSKTGNTTLWTDLVLVSRLYVDFVSPRPCFLKDHRNTKRQNLSCTGSVNMKVPETGVRSEFS